MNHIHNYDVGHEAERRIAKRLTAMGAEDVRLAAAPHDCPDLTFVLNRLRFLVECKTILGVHAGGRMGVAKVSRTEVQSMESALPYLAHKCLIVELRPTTHSKDPVYLYVHWDLVREVYSHRSPAVMSLTFWWLLRNGLPLERIKEVAR